jgi:hypothetical protein
MSTRCGSLAMTTNRVCKKKFSFIIQCKKCCHIHAKYEFNNYAVYIQKCWKGYRGRCVFKNIYVKLPYEIQQKIMFHVRENDLIKKHHHDVITRILDTKCFYFVLINIFESFQKPGVVHYDNLHKVIHLYKLYTKYSTIASIVKLNILEKFALRFIYLSDECYFNNSYQETLIELNFVVILFQNERSIYNHNRYANFQIIL